MTNSCETALRTSVWLLVNYSIDDLAWVSDSVEYKDAAEMELAIVVRQSTVDVG